jgi:hypothetical protein
MPWHDLCVMVGRSMLTEHLIALLPTLGVWMTAGLLSGWLVGMYQSARPR